MFHCLAVTDLTDEIEAHSKWLCCCDTRCCQQALLQERVKAGNAFLRSPMGIFFCGQSNRIVVIKSTKHLILSDDPWDPREACGVLSLLPNTALMMMMIAFPSKQFLFYYLDVSLKCHHGPLWRCLS